MSHVYISAQLRQHVAERARFRCEYCHTQERIIGMPLEVEHIVPTVIGGTHRKIEAMDFCPRYDPYNVVFIDLLSLSLRCRHNGWYV